MEGKTRRTRPDRTRLNQDYHCPEVVIRGIVSEKAELPSESDRIALNQPGTSEENVANAKLIAAAPDLLFACMAVLREIQDGRMPDQKILKKTIKKATE